MDTETDVIPKKVIKGDWIGKKFKADVIAGTSLTTKEFGGEIDGCETPKCTVSGCSFTPVPDITIKSYVNKTGDQDQDVEGDDDEVRLITSQMSKHYIEDVTKQKHDDERRKSGTSCIPHEGPPFQDFTPNPNEEKTKRKRHSFSGTFSTSLLTVTETEEDSCVGRRSTGVKNSKSGPLLTSSSLQVIHSPSEHGLTENINCASDTFPTKTMSSPHPKSPGRVTPKKDDKDETFWDKLGTLGRKKRIKEVQNFEQEGKNAIDSPGSPTQFDVSPDEYDLAEGDERSLIERRSYADPKLQHLIGLLIDWINDELADQRIIVKSIEDDLYDGQILQKLLEKLTGHKLEVPEVSQSEEGQRHKLFVVLNAATQVLGLPRWSQQKWSVESIHSKNLVSILYLLVNLVRHFRAPLRLPENVNVEIVVVKKRNGKLEYRRVTEEITSTYDEFGMRCERDAFDTLLDHAPDKLQVVKKSLITFVNKHLNKINLEVTDVENQFHDGVYLVLLMGLLEGYFVPLFEFHLTPKDFEQKVFNVSFSFELMEDAGISKPKARPEDIVNVDLKSTLRVLYNLFAKYKNAN